MSQETPIKAKATCMAKKPATPKTPKRKRRIPLRLHIVSTDVVSKASGSFSAASRFSATSSFTGSYTTYQIDVYWDSESGWSVQRRMRQFYELQSKLQARFACILPKLPPKTVLRNFSSTFTKNRQQLCQSFLNAILEMPDLAKSDIFRDFIGYDTDQTREGKVGQWGSPDPMLGPADFEVISLIGRGAYGKVFKVRKRDTGDIYAMKVVKKETVQSAQQATNLDCERRLLEWGDHPFVVKLHFAFQTKSKLYLVMDYAPGGDLLNVMKDGLFGESRSKLYLAEIISALEYIHGHGYIFRDLKPENVLLRGDGHLLLADFGLCKYVADRNGVTDTFCGTHNFLAPEILEGYSYGFEMDWWALGVLMHEMLLGALPFYDPNLCNLYKKIIHDDLDLSPHTSLSADAKDLLTKLLTKDPQHRIQIEEIKKHPFFNGLDWSQLYREEINPDYKPKDSDSTLQREQAEDSVASNNSDIVFRDFTFGACQDIEIEQEEQSDSDGMASDQPAAEVSESSLFSLSEEDAEPQPAASMCPEESGIRVVSGDKGVGCVPFEFGVEQSYTPLSDTPPSMDPFSVFRFLLGMTTLSSVVIKE